MEYKLVTIYGNIRPIGNKAVIHRLESMDLVEGEIYTLELKHKIHFKVIKNTDEVVIIKVVHNYLFK